MPTEKTLELNLTRELLDLPNYLWGLVHPVLATAGMSPFSRRYALGLTLREENVQGWDVRIEFPPSAGFRRYALFMQVKAGVHRNFSTCAGPFKGSVRTRKPFCLFSFNDNTGNTQHAVLQALSRQPSLNGAVFYAFPRITSTATLKAVVGWMIPWTTFLTIDDLDAEMTKWGVSPAGEHHFLTSYAPPFVSEVRSKPVDIPEAHDSFGLLFAELVAARTEQIFSVLRPPAAQVKWSPNLNLFRSFQFQLARYLGVSARTFESLSQYQLTREETEVLNAENKRIALHMRSALEGLGGERLEVAGPKGFAPRQEKLFVRTLEALKPYHSPLETGRWVDEELPALSPRFLVPIKENELKLSLASLKGRMEKEELHRALSGIRYQAI